MSSQPPIPERVEILGCAVDCLDMAGTVRRAKQMIESRSPGQQVSINAAKLVALQDDPQLREVIARCALVNADGQSVVWASRLLGCPLPERVAGIDLMGELLGLAEREGYGVYILGAKPEILQHAVDRLRIKHPRLRIVGYHHGYFADEESDVLGAEIRAAAPDILFVAMSSPRKEYWLGDYGPALGIPFLMGVGGSIDVISGHTRRAHRVWQQLGLEWLYRLVQEPRRMWRRYLTTNTRFLWLLAHESLRRRSCRDRS